MGFFTRSRFALLDEILDGEVSDLGSGLSPSESASLFTGRFLRREASLLRTGRPGPGPDLLASSLLGLRRGRGGRKDGRLEMVVSASGQWYGIQDLTRQMRSSSCPGH